MRAVHGVGFLRPLSRRDAVLWLLLTAFPRTCSAATAAPGDSQRSLAYKSSRPSCWGRTQPQPNISMASSTTYSFNTGFTAPNPTGTPRGASAFDPVRDSASQLAANAPASMSSLSSTTAAPTTHLPAQDDISLAQGWQPHPQPAPTTSSAPQQPQNNPPTNEHAEAQRQVVQLCSSLSTIYRFSDTRRMELLRFARTLFGAVPLGDIMARVMERCTQFQILDRLDAQAVQNELLCLAIEELRARLHNTFALTSDQMKNIRVLCMQMLVQPNRVVYMELADAVFIEMQKPEVQASLGLTGALVTASQRQHVLSHVRKTCSSVRNSLRQETRDGAGLHPKKMGDTKALAAFAVHIARKFHSGELESNLVADTRAIFSIKLALLRAFAVDNAHLLAIQEDEDEAAQEPEHGQRVAGSRRKASVGRVKKGEDFWSKVEVHFAMLAQVHGGFKFETESWDVYIKSVIEKDAARIPPPSNAPALAQPAVASTSATSLTAFTPAAAAAGPSDVPLEELWELVGFQPRM